MNKRCDDRGFSVFELLVVLIFLGVLIGSGYLVIKSHKQTNNQKTANSAVSSELGSVQTLEPVSPVTFGEFGNLTASSKPIFPNQPSKVGALADTHLYQAVIIADSDGTKLLAGRLSDKAKGVWQLSESFEIVNEALKPNNPSTITIQSTAVIEWANLPTSHNIARAIALYYQQNPHSAQASTPPPAPAPNPSWSNVTFPPENLRLSFPANVQLKQPAQLSTSIFDASNKAYATSLGSGFTLQIAMIKNPGTFSGYSNQEPAAQKYSFKSGGKQLYLVLNNEGTYLMVSTCPDKICAYTAHSNSSYGILLFANYSGQVKNANGTISSTDQISTNNSYMPTIVKVLESLNY